MLAIHRDSTCYLPHTSVLQSRSADAILARCNVDLVDAGAMPYPEALHSSLYHKQKTADAIGTSVKLFDREQIMCMISKGL